MKTNLTQRNHWGVTDASKYDIGCYNNLFALKFDRHLASTTTKAPVKFQNDCKRLYINLAGLILHETLRYPDDKVHWANMGPTWVLSAPDETHVGPMNHDIGVSSEKMPWFISLLEAEDPYTFKIMPCFPLLICTWWRLYKSVNLVIIIFNNRLLSVRCQVISWTNGDLWSTRIWETAPRNGCTVEV